MTWLYMDVAKVFSQMFWSMQEEFQMKKKNLFFFYRFAN